MRKLLILIIIFLLGFVRVDGVKAASLVAKIETPKSPTNSKDFKIGFVALDLENRAVEVTCHWRKLGGSFSQFDSTKSLPAGGSSGYCQVTSSQISDNADYEFYITATAGSDSVNSSTVTVEYDDSSPGTSTNYSKETQLDGCSVKIKFKTADDGGKTSKVEIYRSETIPFSADSSTRITEIGIGSNLEGEFLTTPPDCSKTYYYAVRAFNSSGTGSGVVGDPGVTTTTTTTVTTPAAGAEAEVVVTTPAEAVAATPAPEEGEVLGEELELGAETTPLGAVKGWTGKIIQFIRNRTKISVGIAALVLIVGYLVYIQLRKKKKTSAD